MEKDELAKRLSYIREKSYGLLDHHDLFRNRRMLREAIEDICQILDELNEEIEEMKKPRDYR